MPGPGSGTSTPGHRSTSYLALLALSVGAIALLLAVDESSLAEQLTLGAAWIIPGVTAFALAGILRDRGLSRADRWILVPAAAIGAGALLWNGVAAEGGTGAGIAIGLISGVAVVAAE